MPTYKKISSNIQQITIQNPKNKERLTWLNVANAGKKEIEYLRKKYTFDLGHLHASSSKVISERPQIIERKSYFFMILHFPVFKNGNIISAEIDFFISHGYLITIHNNDIETLSNFFNSCKKDTTSLLSYELESSAVLLYELLDRLISSCYSLLDYNSKRINKVEDLIFAQRPRRSVSEILSLKRNIINMKRIMQNHKNILKKLTERESMIISKNQTKKLYNTLIENSKRIWEIIEIQKEMIDALHATNESLLNYKISNIMKTLTIVSVMTFPLTLMAAIFSMRVEGGMPLVGDPAGFWVVIGMMLTVSATMLAIFAKKKWL